MTVQSFSFRPKNSAFSKTEKWYFGIGDRLEWNQPKTETNEKNCDKPDEPKLSTSTHQLSVQFTSFLTTWKSWITVHCEKVNSDNTPNRRFICPCSGNPNQLSPIPQAEKKTSGGNVEPLMGCSGSRETRLASEMGASGEHFTVQSTKTDDLVEIETINQELKNAAGVFVLNNALMSLQFFTNHQE